MCLKLVTIIQQHNSGSQSHSADAAEGISNVNYEAGSINSRSSSSQIVALGLGPYDFGIIKNSLLNNRLSNDDKYKVLCNLDQPLQYNFPGIADGKQMRKFQSTWFSKYSWLTYSRSENGGYCACCVAFATGGSLGVLVRTPLVKFRKALEILASHEKTDYHKQARIAHESFLGSMSGRQESNSIQHMKHRR